MIKQFNYATILISCIITILYFPPSIVLQCTGCPSYPCTGGCNAVNDDCTCQYPTFACCMMYGGPCNEFYTFPVFKNNPNAGQINKVVIGGMFTTIYDNSFYTLSTMKQASVCIYRLYGYPTILNVYEYTFDTVNEDGIVSLAFGSYNPLNLTVMSNNQYLTSLEISGAGIQSVPYDTIYHFPVLTKVDLNSNEISEIPTLINSSSLSVINFHQNSLAQLTGNEFNFNALTNLDVSNNKIQMVNEGIFSKWLSASSTNVLNLSGNKLPCDSTIQWMATFAFCQPTQVILATSDLCPSGQPLIEYLSPYANCSPQAIEK